MIVDELLDYLSDKLKHIGIEKMRLGLSYTGVLLEDGRMGLAYSFREEARRCCSIVDSAGKIEENALDLAERVRSTNAVDSSIGVATLNAMVNHDTEKSEGDILDFLNIERGDKVGMVGNFGPVADKIREDVELHVFERNSNDLNVHPDWAAERILPEMDVCIITGTSIVNDTIDHLLDLSAGAREVAVLGPTTPLSERVFSEHGVTFLGGMVVENADKALKIISQGGGTRELKSAAKKVSIDIPERDEYIY